VAEALSDDEIEARLRVAPEEHWRQLADMVAAVEGEAVHGEWAGGETGQTQLVDGVEQPVLQMPYVRYHDTAYRLLGAVHALGASQPFDWIGWGGLQRYPGGAGLDGAAPAESVRIAMAVERADRFTEGTLLAALDDGTLLTAARRLLRWHAANPSA
jgi:hypothetical protein